MNILHEDVTAKILIPGEPFFRKKKKELFNFDKWCFEEWLMILSVNRSNRSQMFFKIGVLKNFAKFTEKDLCWSLFLVKLEACNCIKKKLQPRYFPVDIGKLLSRIPLVAAFVLIQNEKYFIFCRLTFLADVQTCKLFFHDY